MDKTLGLTSHYTTGMTRTLLLTTKMFLLKRFGLAKAQPMVAHPLLLWDLALSKVDLTTELPNLSKFTLD